MTTKISKKVLMFHVDPNFDVKDYNQLGPDHLDVIEYGMSIHEKNPWKITTTENTNIYQFELTVDDSDGNKWMKWIENVLGFEKIISQSDVNVSTQD
jgi:hypothetical protein